MGASDDPLQSLEPRRELARFGQLCWHVIATLLHVDLNHIHLMMKALRCPASQAADSFVSQREAEEQRRRHEAHEKAAEKAFQLRRAAVSKQEKVGSQSSYPETRDVESVGS